MGLGLGSYGEYGSETSEEAGADLPVGREMVEAGSLCLVGGFWLGEDAGIGAGDHCVELRGSTWVVVQAGSRSSGKSNAGTSFISGGEVRKGP